MQRVTEDHASRMAQRRSFNSPRCSNSSRPYRKISQCVTRYWRTILCLNQRGIRRRGDGQLLYNTRGRDIRGRERDVEHTAFHTRSNKSFPSIIEGNKLHGNDHVNESLFRAPERASSYDSLCALKFPERITIPEQC